MIEFGDPHDYVGDKWECSLCGESELAHRLKTDLAATKRELAEALETQAHDQRRVAAALSAANQMETDIDILQGRFCADMVRKAIANAK